MEDSGLVNWQRRTRNEYEHFSAEKWWRTRNEYEHFLTQQQWMAILIPKILRYSFIQAQCREAGSPAV